jgi:glycosyltransferase involved in cell wall biosynthesis
MTIHVLHLITGLGVGGAEHMLEKLATATERSGFRNTVVSLSRSDQIGERIKRAGIDVRQLNMTSIASLPRTILQLRRLLAELKPDILQTWLYHADMVGTLTHMLSPTDARLLWNLRCSNMDMSQYSFGTRWVLRFLPLLSLRPLRIISNTQAGRQYHIGLGYRVDGWVLLPNGFDLSAFGAKPEARARLRSQLGIADDTNLIGMIARRDPMKDHDNFLAMARKLASQRSDVQFMLVGRGCEPDSQWGLAAKSGLGERLHLLGERGDIADLLPALDIMTLTSAYGEGFPNVLGEALATGVPCIATDVGDSARILGDCGLIVPPRDSTALVAAVHHILNMPAAERVAWRQKMRLRAEREFSLANVADRYENLYREVLATRP